MTPNSSGAEVQPQDLARRLYEALGDGDAGAVRDLLHPRFRGRATEGLPLGLGGPHDGPEAMTEDFWWRIGRHYRARAVPGQFLPLADGGLLVLGRYVGEARDGGVLDAAFAHVIRARDGQISELAQYTDSQRWAAALVSTGPFSPSELSNPVTPSNPTADPQPAPPQWAPSRPPPISPIEPLSHQNPFSPDRPSGPIEPSAGRTLTTIEYELSGSVATIRLRRPRGNAIDLALVEDLYAAVFRAGGDPGVRAVLIAGTGRSLSSGGDLAMLGGLAPGALPGMLRAMTDTYHLALERLTRLDAPVVCAVRGAAAGGGLGLVHVSDVVVAAEDSKFALGYAALGLPADGGNSWFLPRVTGLRRAQELMLLNRTLTGREALEWGLVTEVVPDEAVEDRAAELARRLARGPTAAFGRMKRLLRASWTTDLPGQFIAETEEMAAAAADPDAAEGIAAFVAKRAPRFRGRPNGSG